MSETDAANTALLVAAFNGREDRVRDLLRREDINPNISYSNGVIYHISVYFTCNLYTLQATHL